MLCRSIQKKFVLQICAWPEYISVFQHTARAFTSPGRVRVEIPILNQKNLFLEFV